MKEEARQIQEYLEIECSNNPAEIQERISTLNVYMARSGEMLAQARRIYNKKVSSEIANTIIKIAKEQYLSATAQNALVKSIAEDEQFMVDWLERIGEKMAQSSMKKWETDKLTITVIESTNRSTFDSKAFQKEHTDLYNQYVKETQSKGYIKIKLN